MQDNSEQTDLEVMEVQRQGLTNSKQNKKSENTSRDVIHDHTSNQRLQEVALQGRQFAVQWSAQSQAYDKRSALTIELPTQMVMVSSYLFFIAIQTEVTCSAAFPYRRC
jgi:hypothetical protein